MCPRVIICPNPKCHKKIEEPVLLSNLSTTPAEQYYACPHCLIKLNAYATRANLAGLFLTAFGSITLAWVGWLIWYDTTVFSKDMALILFGSRTGETISLGIGMKVIYYFLMGLALLLPGLVTFLRRRSKAVESNISAIAPEKENACAEEVTLRLPKKLVNYLKALEEHMGATVEEHHQDSVFGRVTADMARARADIDALDVLVLTQLIEEYGLKEILKYK